MGCRTARFWLTQECSTADPRRAIGARLRFFGFQLRAWVSRLLLNANCPRIRETGRDVGRHRQGCALIQFNSRDAGPYLESGRRSSYHGYDRGAWMSSLPRVLPAPDHGGAPWVPRPIAATGSLSACYHAFRGQRAPASSSASGRCRRRLATGRTDSGGNASQKKRDCGQ